MPENLWTEVHDIVQKAMIKTILKKKKCKKAKWLSEEALLFCEKKKSERQRRKGKIYPLDVEFQRIARRDKKGFLSDQRKEIEENNKMGKTRVLFKKIRHQGNISCKGGLNKGQK